MEPVLDVRRAWTRRIAVAVWAVVLVGVLVASRAVIREPGEPLLPVAVLVGAGFGVLVSVTGCAWFLTQASGFPRSGPSSMPRLVRRAVVRLEPVPEPYGDLVPAWLEVRLAVVRTVPALMMWFFAQACAITAVQNAGWLGQAVAASLWGVVTLVVGGCVAVYRYRIQRARRHFRHLATT